MATDTQEPAPGTREHVLQVTQLRRWGTIQEDVERCRAQGSFTPTFYAAAVAQMARIHVWRRRKPVTTAHGWPVFGNIARVGPEAYRQIVASHDRLARHHLFKAQTSRDHATARDGLPLPLFGEDDGEVGSEGEA